MADVASAAINDAIKNATSMPKITPRAIPMRIPCDHSGCRENASNDYQWSGRLPVQTASFCRQHGEELWETLRPLCIANRASFRIDGPGKIKAESEDEPVLFQGKEIP